MEMEDLSYHCVYWIPTGFTDAKSGNGGNHEVGSYDRQRQGVRNDAKVCHQVDLLLFERLACAMHAPNRSCLKFQ